MAPIRQYVNLPINLENNQGSLFWLNVEIKEDTAGNSEGQPVYLFLEADPNNLAKKYLPMYMRAEGFRFEPPDRKLVTVKKKKAMSLVRLSSAGGDKFKFKSGKKVDRSGAVDADVEVEIWRKIYLRFGFMQPRGEQAKKNPTPPVAKMATVKSELEKVFVEMETFGPYQVKYEPWSNKFESVANLEAGQPPLPFSNPSVPMVFVDRIGLSSEITLDPVMLPAASLKANKVKDITIPGGKYTWPDDKAWLTGKIECLDETGAVTQTTNKVHGVVRKVGGHAHPEGTATQKIQLNFSEVKGLDAWLDSKKVTMRITLKVQIIEKGAMGRASGSPPQILIATRRPYNYKPSDKLENTVVHEIGHTLGLGVLWVAQYDETTGSFTSYEKNQEWYDDANGGRGKHCKTGAKKDKNDEYEKGTCTMLHYANGKTAYCPECALHVKRANLRKLGANNVWSGRERERNREKPETKPGS